MPLGDAPIASHTDGGPRREHHPFTPEEFDMAAVCDVCGKGPGFGKSVSHSHRRTNRRWNPNIQSVRVEVAPGNRKRKNVCTSCLKAGKTTLV
jgi:large subunit ribosomal protein L28